MKRIRTFHGVSRLPESGNESILKVANQLIMEHRKVAVRHTLAALDNYVEVVLHQELPKEKEVVVREALHNYKDQPIDIANLPELMEKILSQDLTEIHPDLFVKEINDTITTYLLKDGDVLSGT